MLSSICVWVVISTFVPVIIQCDLSTIKKDAKETQGAEFRFLKERLSDLETKFQQQQNGCNTHEKSPVSDRGALLEREIFKLRLEVDKIKRACSRQEKRFVADGEMNFEQEVLRLSQEVNQIKLGIGSTFVRWGRTVCPNNSSLVYKGYMGGNSYTDKGGPANYVCLPEDPMWAKYEDGIQDNGNRMYGTEYELYKSFNPFSKQMHDEDAPCAVCRTNHDTTIMIPARTDCYSGWQRQYTGYLMTIHFIHGAASEYVCVDKDPEELVNGSANQNGNVLYVVEAVCGSLPCLPYVDGRELACVVCSK